MRVLAVSLLTAAAAMVSLQGQQAGRSVDPPAGSQMVLQAKGDGVQIYTCTAGAGGMQWTLKAPDARLLDSSGNPIGRHFAGPTWRLKDGGQVQGELIASRPAPEPGSAAWLLLRAKAGTGEGSLAAVAFIRRTETHGGAAPASGCLDSGDVGKSVRVPYTATYTFYRQ